MERYHPTIDASNADGNIVVYESKLEGIDRVRFQFCIVDEAHNAKRVAGAVDDLLRQFRWESLWVTGPRRTYQVDEMRFFRSNDYLRFDLEHPRKAIFIRAFIKWNLIKTGTAFKMACVEFQDDPFQ
ncbi:hypothetical protein FACUT_1009 [Fusarium acutatum]|uniref:SNF2 N-terminal domain-containing protein n=1 Tax=Fusarium acutatum TaxID=78861 RepID=A0A8H4K6Y2_9HYPO|nr:hypothetical protein FACUT_1009 [Fusarium acutatum]